MRANTNISLKNRKQVELNDFKGVDFSSSPLRVKQNRASNMRNFINEYGVNHKRHGWNELFKIRDDDGNVQRINGVFECFNNLIVYAGNCFYEVHDNDSQYVVKNLIDTCTYDIAKVDRSRLKDQRCEVFFNNGRAYFVGCGDFLVYGSWDNGNTYELRRVADNEDTYIPTTTTHIENDKITNSEYKTSEDDINMLSSYRKNTIIGVDEASITFTIDTQKIEENSDVEVKVKVLENSKEVEKVLTNSKTDKTKLYLNNSEIGTINFESGKITLNMNTKPIADYDDNIEVKFKSTYYGDRITNASFGILFGTNGNSDRLFVSGNAEYKNIVYYSEPHNTLENPNDDDFTYFGLQKSIKFGSDASAILGFQRLSDNTLVVHKQDIGQETTIFYVTGSYEEEYDDNNVISSIKYYFTSTAGSIGDEIVSRYASANFAGDNVILTRNGVYGIELSDNIATVERYIRERSRYINEQLKDHSNLEEAIAIVFENKYFLAIDNVCYVADARFKSTSDGDMPDTFNYEWWYWDNIPARVWAKINGKLYFGTANGQVCVFDDGYTDKEYLNADVGDISLSVAENKFNYNNKKIEDIVDGDKIKFMNDIWTEFLNQDHILKVEDNYIYVSEDDILKIFNGVEVYADDVQDSGLIVGDKYYIKEVDFGTCKFKLESVDGNDVLINSSNFKLVKNHKNQDLLLINATTTDFQVKQFKKDTEPLVITKYNNTLATNITADIMRNRNVCAEWITPVFDFGTNAESKILLGITIATEPTVNGQIEFGFDTKNASKLLQAKGVNVFSFSNLSFENFSFDTGFASSYTKKLKQRFNFIIFRFKSDNEYDCAVNSFSVNYKINNANKGVK